MLGGSSNPTRAMALKMRIRGTEGTEAERRLAALLFDEQKHVLSTFDMNVVASLTYQHETCEQIFDLLEEVMRFPLDFGVLTTQKSLFCMQHVLIYGSEKCVNSCWALASHVETLKEFNTVLWTQQQAGLGSWWQNIKGGGVDTGYPVREAAEKLHALLQNAPRIQQLRHDHADPNSLVPVGSTDKVAFCSDDVRRQILQKRMEQHTRLTTKSNLKSGGGFGSGYNAQNGKTVVGAAHSMEEMLARAEREQKKFTETGPVHYKPKPAVQPTPVIAAYGAPAPPIDLLDFGGSTPAPASAAAPVEVDLLGFGGGAAAAKPVLDIFAPVAATPNNSSADLMLGGGGRASDPFAPADPFASGAITEQPLKDGTTAATTAGDLLSVMTLSAPNTASSSLTSAGGMPPPPASNNDDDLLSTMALSGAATVSSSIATTSVMGGGGMGGGGMSGMSGGSNNLMAAAAPMDRFAALDALSPPQAEVTKTVQKYAGMEAEHRILNFSTSRTTSAVSDISMMTTTSAPPSAGAPLSVPPSDYMTTGTTTTNDDAPMVAPMMVDDSDDGFGGGAAMGGPPVVAAAMGGAIGLSMGAENIGVAMQQHDIPTPPHSMPPPSMPPPPPPASPPPLPPSSPPPYNKPVVVDTSAIAMAPRYGGGGNDDGDDDGFVMGGTSGMGMGSVPST